MNEEYVTQFCEGVKIGGLTPDEYEVVAREQGALDRREGNTFYLRQPVVIDCKGIHAAISVD